MKILLSSHFFHPRIGGIEQVSGILSEQFTRLGHEVTVVTTTPDPGNSSYPYGVVRNPSSTGLLELVRGCDVFFHNNISLRMAWPLALVRRPWIVAHHTWIARPDGNIALQDRLKLSLVRRATNIAISKAIAERLGAPSVIIGDPYRDELFRENPAIPRDKDLLFVGRLVSDKGVALLLEALRLANARGAHRELTIVGDGPELDSLRERAESLPVIFAGLKESHELVSILQSHRTLVVPSLWQEPFGIVALEAIACGCTVIGSSGGGLPDAIGPCGATFPNGDVSALAALLMRDLPRESLRANAADHLAKHRAEFVAAEYLDIFERARQ